MPLLDFSKADAVPKKTPVTPPAVPQTRADRIRASAAALQTPAAQAANAASQQRDVNAIGDVAGNVVKSGALVGGAVTHPFQLFSKKGREKLRDDAEKTPAALTELAQPFGAFQDVLGGIAQDVQQRGIGSLFESDPNAQTQTNQTAQELMHAVIDDPKHMLKRIGDVNKRRMVLNPEVLAKLQKGGGAIGAGADALAKNPLLDFGASFAVEAGNPIGGAAGAAARGAVRGAGSASRTLGDVADVHPAAREARAAAQAGNPGSVPVARRAIDAPFNEIDKTRDNVGRATNIYHDAAKSKVKGLLAWRQRQEAAVESQSRAKIDSVRDTVFGGLTKEQKIEVTHSLMESNAPNSVAQHMHNDPAYVVPEPKKGPSLQERANTLRDYSQDLDARQEAAHPDLLPYRSNVPFFSRAGTAQRPVYRTKPPEVERGAGGFGTGGKMGAAKGARNSAERKGDTLLDVLQTGAELHPDYDPAAQFQKWALDRERATASTVGMQELQKLPIGATDSITGAPANVRESPRYFRDDNGTRLLFANGTGDAARKAAGSYATREARARAELQVGAEPPRPIQPPQLLRGRLIETRKRAAQAERATTDLASSLQRVGNAHDGQRFQNVLDPQTQRTQALGQAVTDNLADRARLKSDAASVSEGARDLGTAAKEARAAASASYASGLGDGVDSWVNQIAAHRLAKPAGTNLTTRVDGAGDTHVLGSASSFQGSQFTKQEVNDVRVAIDRARKADPSIAPEPAKPLEAVQPPSVKPNAFRYQQTAGNEPEVSRFRKGTFISLGDPENPTSSTYRKDPNHVYAGVEGGANRVDVHYNPKNEVSRKDIQQKLIERMGRRSMEARVAELTGKRERGETLTRVEENELKEMQPDSLNYEAAVDRHGLTRYNELINKSNAIHGEMTPARRNSIRRLLRLAGIDEQTAREVSELGMRGETYGATGNPLGPAWETKDAILGAFARSLGHDAIRDGNEAFVLDPAAMRAPSVTPPPVRAAKAKAPKATMEEALAHLNEAVGLHGEAHAKIDALAKEHNLNSTSKFVDSQGYDRTRTSKMPAESMEPELKRQAKAYRDYAKSLRSEREARVPLPKEFKGHVAGVVKGQEKTVQGMTDEVARQQAKAANVSVAAVKRSVRTTLQAKADLETIKAALDKARVDTAAHAAWKTMFDKRVGQYEKQILEEITHPPQVAAHGAENPYRREADLSMGVPDGDVNYIHKDAYRSLEEARKMTPPKSQEDMNWLWRFFVATGHLSRAAIIVWPTVHAVWNLGRAFLAEGGNIGKMNSADTSIDAAGLARIQQTPGHEWVTPGMTWGEFGERAGAIDAKRQGSFGIGPESDATVRTSPYSELTSRGKADKFLSQGARVPLPPIGPLRGKALKIPGMDDNNWLVFHVFERRYAGELLRKFITEDGMDVGSAARRVRQALGDHHNITATEQRLGARSGAFMFYSWMKTVIPFWTKQGFFHPNSWQAPITAARQEREDSNDPEADFVPNLWTIDAWHNDDGSFERVGLPDPARVVEPVAQAARAPIDFMRGEVGADRNGKPELHQGFGAMTDDLAPAANYLRGHLNPVAALPVDLTFPGNSYQRLENDPRESSGQQLKDAGGRVIESVAPPTQWFADALADPKGAALGRALGVEPYQSRPLDGPPKVTPQGFSVAGITKHYDREITSAMRRGDIDKAIELRSEMEVKLAGTQNGPTAAAVSPTPAPTSTGALLDFSR